MKISELQAQLEAIKQEYGDLPTMIMDTCGISFHLSIGHAKLYTGEDFVVFGSVSVQNKNLRPYLHEVNDDNQ